eukprot:9620190-Lingulodinium_polyedra.AAC.1
MERFISSYVGKYCELVQAKDLRAVPTPSFPENAEDVTPGRPASTGPVVECPWSLNTCPPIARVSLRAFDVSKLKAQ